MNKLTEAFNFRHACKVFDETKKITREEMVYILEAGRTSPSSFGMEPWHFIVINDDNIKAQLQPFCFDQPQIGSCSHLVVVLYRKASHFTIQSDYLRKTVQKTLPTEGAEFTLDEACQYFINYANYLPEGYHLNYWSETQCYIPCANMMTAAAYVEIDSCCIGGFEHDKLMQALEQLAPQFSNDHFGIALCLAFGYRKNAQSPQIRWSLEENTTFL